jgi:hypothetical protein
LSVIMSQLPELGVPVASTDVRSAIELLEGGVAQRHGHAFVRRRPGRRGKEGVKSLNRRLSAVITRRPA